MVNKIASLFCGADIDKIQKESSRINQENTRLKAEKNILSDSMRTLEQANKKKEILINEYEIRLKGQDKTISELSQTIAKLQDEYATLQKKYEDLKRCLNTNLSSVIAIVKLCDYVYIANEYSKSESIQEILNLLEILLNQNDIYSIMDVDVEFNENIHRVNEVIATDDDMQDMKICESLKRGFRKGQQCIEPQEVKITKKKKL